MKQLPNLPVHSGFNHEKCRFLWPDLWLPGKDVLFKKAGTRVDDKPGIGLNQLISANQG
ncbi:hypothetical protein [Flavihumibacter profundi]|uniref:hypothetical protein n=1 Tax=Flavihumibacter profundi TaxID=2716883 RepID=UPI001CC6A1A3|nr:hypothetical protein [Flavihumibacter profundi]MBZ5857782.1 hypothetical protein [Flavihumibacter profundi]